MSNELEIPLGAPCWMDLMTTDVDGSIDFYGQLFGWECKESPPQFGGYRYFEKDGKGVGGCMENKAEWGAPNGWAIFLKTDDADATASLAKNNGGDVLMPAMKVEENGTFTIVQDPGGATISAWQPGTEKGFGVLRENGSPVHFELHTRDYDKVMQFYRDVFGWTPQILAEEEHFRYSTFGPESYPRAGIMDASEFLPEGAPSQWSVYLGTADLDATLKLVEDLGGTVTQGPDDTPYGRLAAVTDPAGAVFKLRG